MSAKLIKRFETNEVALTAFSFPIGAQDLATSGAQVLTGTQDFAPSNFPAFADEESLNADLTADEARAEAAEIVATAKEAANQIIAQAQARAAAIADEAHAEGWETARREALQAMSAELAPARHNFSDALIEIDKLHQTLAAAAETDLIQLAIKIAGKIVAREVAVDRTIAVTLARVALSRLNARAFARIHLHPADYLFAATNATLQTATIELIEDETIELGGCLIRTDTGDIDARINEQFAALEREFISL